MVKTRMKVYTSSKDMSIFLQRGGFSRKTEAKLYANNVEVPLNQAIRLRIPHLCSKMSLQER